MIHPAAAVLLAATAAAAVALAAPALPRQPAATARPVTATVVASTILPSQRDVAVPLRDISGIAFDVARSRWIAVSDDNERPRWYAATFAVTGSTLTASFAAPTFAQFPAHAPGVAGHADFEAVVRLPDERLLIASEGGRAADAPASLLIFEGDGRFVRTVPVPAKFLPESSGTERGLRNNRGFESLALSPDGTRLFALAESPLLQDDDLADDRHTVRCRLLELVRDGDSFRPAREFVYPLGPLVTPAIWKDTAILDDFGASDLAILPDGTMVSLERAYLRDRVSGESRNVVHLYRLSLAEAEDVSHLDTLRGHQRLTTVHKELIVDLNALTTLLPPRLSTLDNFEALTLGPPLAGGMSLLAMSDDNFRMSQVSAVVLLRLTGW